MSIKDEINKEAEKYGAKPGNSSYFTFKEGVNRVRVLNHLSVLAIHFFGKGNPAVTCVGVDEGCPHHKEGDDKPSLKLVTYVIDRSDSGIKMAELPLSVSYALNDLQEDEDFGFSEFPMPYDIKIIHDPKNPDPKLRYRVSPSPEKSPLTEEEQKLFDEKMKTMTPEQYKDRKKGKTSDPDEISPDDIPFN